MDLLRSTIQRDITKAINESKEEIFEHISGIRDEQSSIKEDVSKLEKRIANLENKKLILERQITELQSSKEIRKPVPELDFERTKKFIIYGLKEHNNETENDLHDRMIQIIGEIMNVNIVGYIEKIARIGRKGYRRPIMVGLISKRMTRYILENSSCFKIPD
ncbi:hypothetical protein O0L34_g17861 [Tuta absoluta]|nr:hypothetical protein O0L34_g17861 [Tuta absoluta]